LAASEQDRGACAREDRKDVRRVEIPGGVLAVTKRRVSVVDLAEREVCVDEVGGGQRALWQRDFGGVAAERLNKCRHAAVNSVRGVSISAASSATCRALVASPVASWTAASSQRGIALARVTGRFLPL
jgi:hypothetical protein